MGVLSNRAIAGEVLCSCDDSVSLKRFCHEFCHLTHHGRVTGERSLAYRFTFQISKNIGDRRPTGWLPGRAELDATWRRLDDGLLSDRWYGAGAQGGGSSAAVEQALAILDSQGVGGAGDGAAAGVVPGDPAGPAGGGGVWT